MNIHRKILFLIILFMPSLLLAEGMTLEQIAKTRAVTQVAISPDGERIAYVRMVPRDLSREDDGGPWTQLHVIGPDGNSRPYITGQVNVGNIGWKPDGSAITFLTRRGEDNARQLYSIPVDGGEATRLTDMPAGVAGYSFSPNGDQVALIASEEIPSDEQRLIDKGFSQIVYEEDWRPRRLWTLSLNDDDAEPDMVEIFGSVQTVHWSPAGDRLAVVVTPRQLVDDTLMFQRIRIITPTGDEIGRVDNPGKLGQIAWSPDGAYLSLLATESIHDTREGRLMIASGDGGDWTNLIPGLEGHVWNVDWLADDEMIFVSHEGTETRLGRIAPDGTGHDTFFQHDGLIFSSISVASDGRVATVASASEHPGEVFVIDDAEPTRLTDSNPWLGDVQLARQEVITYPAADGLEIEGILFWPLDYREGERYPLILAVHGGPEAHYSNGWLTTYNLPAHHAAAEGYFMFYPNYRGSTGRGVEFTETSQGRPAKEEFDDLVDGVDYLISRGLVDPDRVGITGGSYGGYASAWGATYYTERFAAAVMNVGLSDKISMLGTSDIPQELYLVHYLTWPWEDWDMYKKASPIYYAQQAQTPILILHGDADPRVDPTQSRILYRYLTLQEDPPPVRLGLYRGEGHGNQRAASRWDYSLRLMRWMDHYLKGEGGDPPPYRIDYGFDSDD